MLRHLLALPVLLSSVATAQVTSLGPFVGESFEGFETQHEQVGGQHPPTGAFCVLGGLFDGQATLCTAGTFPSIQLAGSSFASCSSIHRTGSYYGACLFSEFSIDFATPQAAFGGYFMTDNAVPGDPASLTWEVRFIDALGIGSAGTQLLLNGCGDISWAGWSLPPGTVRIEFEPMVFGRTLRFDDLMASTTLPLGASYCEANETSIETRAYCAATGSSVAAAGDLTLIASQLPPSVFGFFLVSRDAGFVANPGGSAGNLCLGGTIGRLTAPGQILFSGPGGSFSLTLDLSALPQGATAAAAQAGDTWRFQAWFRDVEPGPLMIGTSNFTAGLELTFS